MPAFFMIGRACEDIGFFYISNHGVPQAIQRRPGRTALLATGRRRARPARPATPPGPRWPSPP